MATVGISAISQRVPVNAISTSNLTLSGTQTVDSVALTAGMLCAALGQSDNKNAVYLVQPGAWIPCNPGIGTGLEVYATGGSANVNTVYGCDTTGAIIWGTTTTTFTLKGTTGSAFNPASPGAIGGTNPAAGTFTTTKAVREQLSGTSSSPLAGYLDETGYKLQGSSTLNAIQLSGEIGSRAIVGNGSTSATSATFLDLCTVVLNNNATFDYPMLGLDGGFVTLAAPANSSATIGGTVYFGADASTTLGGLAPTNISVTLGTSGKINVAASGGNLRFENKTGGQVGLLLAVHMIVSG
jgi:hypothetical protein